MEKKYNDTIEQIIDAGTQKWIVRVELPYSLQGAIYELTDEDKQELYEKVRKTEKEWNLDDIELSWDKNHGLISIGFSGASDSKLTFSDDYFTTNNITIGSEAIAFHEIVCKYREILESKI